MISDTFYVFTFNGSALEFYIDPHKSVRHIELLASEHEAIKGDFDVFDNSFESNFEPTVIKLYRRVSISSPVKVYKEAMRFASMCIGK